MKRHFHKMRATRPLTSCIICILVLLSACQTKKAQPPKKPNVVLINVDDLGWKDLGFMGSGYYETPNLDA